MVSRAESEAQDRGRYVGRKACWKKWVFRWCRKVSRLVDIRIAGGREFQILGAATLKLRAPNEVRTNGMDSRLVFDNLRERVEWWACKAECR